MGKFLLVFALTVVLVLFVGKWFPFWILMVLVAITCFLTGIGATRGFFAGGLGFGLAWLILTIWISIDSGSDLPQKVAELMGLKNDNLLWFGTGIVGFLIGGFSGLTGSTFKKIFERRDSNIYKTRP
jgi:hypothetical protein